MKRLALALLLAGIVFPGAALAYESPGAPTGYVNDFANVLSLDAKTGLEAELAAFTASTTNEIAVAIVPDMGGDYIENYAVKLFEDWGIGGAQNDNGVLLVIALEEREMRIEVGYGLEGALPDSVAQNILDDELTPYLRDGDYDKGVAEGVRAIMAATAGEYGTTGAGPDIGGALSWILESGGFVFMIAILILQWLGSIFARSKSWWAGGVVGLLGGAGISALFGLGLAIIAPIAIVLGLLGLGFDYIVSNAYKWSKSHNTKTPWWAGGNTLGGGSSWGGTSGGGFGGFGGGMSGGGGASGRW